MPASGHTVELIATREINLFLPVMRELADDFGDRFLLSMLHWCGIGRRPVPIPFWEVFLLRRATETIGVCGLYQTPKTPSSRIWVGWFGIRPAFRRKGYGTAAIHALTDKGRRMACTELWVYTGRPDEGARTFYTKLGFEVLGPASERAAGMTMDESDIVLMLPLCPS